MSLLAIVLALVAVILLVPCAILLVQVMAALLPARQSVSRQPVDSSNVAIDVCLLMPAHNEASGIAAVLDALLPQLGSHVRLLVVADNCTDSTAILARKAGGSTGSVTVLERHDDRLRG